MPNAHGFCLVAAILAGMMPSVAPAQGPSAIPDTCTALVAIRLANCDSLHQWHCSGEPAGDFWLSTQDPSGAERRRVRLTGLTLLEVRYGFGERRAVTPSADPESYDTLIKPGVDTYDHIQISVTTGREMQVTGPSTISGPAVTIDGVGLYPVESTSTFRSRNITSRETIQQYMMIDLPIWLPAVQGSVAFMWPGDTGFGENAQRTPALS